MTQTMLLLLLGSGALLTAGVVVFVLRSWHSVAPGHALIVNRMRAEPTVTFNGALVLPIVHRAERIDLSVNTLTIVRRGKDGVICSDNIRVDIVVRFQVRVNPTADDILRVARAVGCARATDPDTLEGLFTARFSEAIKTAARQLEFAELHTQREAFKDRIIEIIGKDLTGYVLEDAAIDELDQTPIELLDPNNVLDALGIRKIQQVVAGTRTRLAHESAPPPPPTPESFDDQLRRLGLLDIRVTTEVACDVSTQRAAVSAHLGGDDDAVLAQLPSSVTRSLLAALGAGELVCRDGVAAFRWTSAPVTEPQLLAGARLVHAFRDAEQAFR